MLFKKELKRDKKKWRIRALRQAEGAKGGDRKNGGYSSKDVSDEVWFNLI